MKAIVVVPAGVALVVMAYVAGRAGRPAETPAPARPAKAPTVEAPRPEPVPPAEPPREVTEADRTKAAAKLKELQAELRRAVETRPAALNDLQNFLNAALAEGRLTPSMILEMFRTEQDGAALDVLQGALAGVPELADAPGVKDEFERVARSDASLERRQAAIAFLGSVADREGRLGRTLLALAQGDGDTSVRLTALGALAGYAQKNGEQAAAVNAGLIDIARTGSNADDVRMQAVSGIEIRAADESTFRRVSEFLSDRSDAVRLASAEKLGEVKPAYRSSTVAVLESALGREGEAMVKSLLLSSLVKAGRGEAVAALERAAARDPQVRADAQDYIAILRAGYVDWSDIVAEKSKREVTK